MARRTDPFTAAARRHFVEAAGHGFPAFAGDIAQSSPLNASPWLAHLGDFDAIVAGWPCRGALLRAMEETRSEASRCGVAVDAVMLGGSFVDPSRAAPGDVDCLMFYRQAHPDRPVQADSLAALQRQAKDRRVDVRFLPVDGDPLLLIKCVGYFARLFAMTKGSANAAVHGLVLLDCRD